MGSVRMPPGKRMASALCFDFDALSLWLGLFRMTTANPLSRGEFGATVGVPRILDILDRQKCKATFFVPGHTAITFPDAVREIHDRGHEVAAHSMYHAPYEVGLAMSGKDPATPEQQRRYLVEQIEALEKVTGVKPVGFRSPIGDWVGEHIPQFLVELGFKYDSSLQGHDFVPYRLRIGDRYETEEPYRVTFGEPSPLLEIPLHWDTNDFAQFEFLGYYMNQSNPWFSPSPFGTPSQVRENFTKSFDYCYDSVPGGIYNTILHPQCCGRDLKAAWLEDLIGYVTSRDDVWIATMSEVADAYDDELADPTPAIKGRTAT